jgi:hypothetical protein
MEKDTKHQMELRSGSGSGNKPDAMWKQKPSSGDVPIRTVIEGKNNQSVKFTKKERQTTKSSLIQG